MAAINLESIYLNESPEIARSILLPLAESGNTDAQLYLGHLCDEESPRNLQEALNWYKLASDGGHLEATHFLASFTFFGYGTEQDIPKALILFYRAANAGYAASQWKLGEYLLLQSGKREEAIEWVSKSAEQGNEAALDLLNKIKLGSA